MTPYFETELVDKAGPDRFRWTLTADLVFIDSRGRRWVVPKGFVTDYASVPRLLWPIIPLRDGEYDPAAALHDYLVRYRTVLGLSLTECHGLFREAMEARGVAKLRRGAMWAGVYGFNWMICGRGDGTTRYWWLPRFRNTPETPPSTDEARETAPNPPPDTEKTG